MSRTDSLPQANDRAATASFLAQNTHNKLQNKEHIVALVYPPQWVVPLSPLAEEMESKAETWLLEKGVIQDEKGLEKFRKLAVGEYANWPFPHADPAEAEIITKFLSLWIFYDDVIEEADDGQQDLIFQVISGQPKEFPGGDLFARCWWELGQAYSERMSRRWLERHATRFALWVRGVREECLAANYFRDSGVHPNAVKHLERRGVNIGMIPNIDFLEYQMGWELPESLLQNPIMKKLEILSAEVVAITNDIFGFAKDRRYRWCNLVACLMEEFGISLEEAFQWVCDMHNARVREIALREGQLLAQCGDAQRLTQWLHGLHHIMYGFARWHAMAPRYDSVHDLGEEKKLRIAVQDFTDR